MKNYTSQSAGQSYSWLCIMLTSHNHRCGDRGRDVGRGEETRGEEKERREKGRVKGEKSVMEKDEVKWSEEEKKL